MSEAGVQRGLSISWISGDPIFSGVISAAPLSTDGGHFFSVKMCDERLDGFVAHLRGVLRHQRLDLPFFQGLHERVRGVESDELGLTREVILPKREQHAEGQRFVGAKDAVGLANEVDHVHHRRGLRFAGRSRRRNGSRRACESPGSFS